MFSFFRKNSDEPLNPAAHAPSSARPAQPAPAAPAEQAVSGAVFLQENNGPHQIKAHTESHAIGSFDSDAVAAREMGSVEEEAAILYASDHAEQAAALLLDFIRNHPDRQDIYPWMMLFDIYQIQGEMQLFDELALEFVVKFERSAPIWDAAKVPDADARKPQAAPASEGYVSLAGILLGDQDSLFQGMLQTAQKSAGLRIDFARLEGLDASGSRRLVETIQGLKKAGKKVVPVSESRLIDLLKGMIGQGGAEEPAHWQLLLNLYQCRGMEAEFEDLAVEFAVTFEVSPPSWEAMPQCKQAVTVAETPSFAVVAPHDDYVFYLSGVISAASENQFQELTRFAAGLNEICLDMTHVPRVDFVSVGNFAGMLASLSSSGKTVLIRNANEMIRALFSVMEVNQYSTVLRRRVC